jgi:sulfite reductase (ferredoxin)
VETNEIQLATTFKELVYQIKANEASEVFAKEYLEQAKAFFETIEKYREKDLADA